MADVNLTGTGLAGAASAGAMPTQDVMAYIFGLIIVIMIVAIIAIAIYVYTALAWMRIAKKSKTEPAWLAWIPIANNYLMSKIAGMHWWPILLIAPMIIFAILMIVPALQIISQILYYACAILFGIFSLIWTWKAFEKVGRPGWWAIIGIIIELPGWILIITQNTVAMIIGALLMIAGAIVSVVMLGIVAWGNAPGKTAIRKKSRK